MTRPSAGLPSLAPHSSLTSHSIHPFADLAQNKMFEDPAFVKYLAYLQYWRVRNFPRWSHREHAASLPLLAAAREVAWLLAI